MGFTHRLLWGSGTEEFWLHREKAARARSGLLRRWHAYRAARIMFENGASIPSTAVIDGRITLPHGLAGVFVSSGARIGKNCTVYQQVTIGSNTLPDAKRPGSPTLGDNVYVGAGAKIIGGITVGSGARIGANCVVFTDVPENATVVLPAPRVLLCSEKHDNTFRAMPHPARGGADN